jgi:hypothetical protein
MNADLYFQRQADLERIYADDQLREQLYALALPRVTKGDVDAMLADWRKLGKLVTHTESGAEAFLREAMHAIIAAQSGKSG